MTPEKQNADVTSADVYFIKIFASWCGACTAFKPEWDKLKEKNRANDKIKFEEIEETEFNNKSHSLFKHPVVGELLKKAEVPHYPTLVKIENGKIEYFNDERTPANLAKWIGHGMVGGAGRKKSGQPRRTTSAYRRKSGKKMGKKYTRKCGKKHRRTYKNWMMF